jgi:Na+/H+ antiporter NhaD/arsenite permease-like protein
MILSVILKMSKAKSNLTSKGKTIMEKTNAKKITTRQVFKVIMIIYSCVVIGFVIHTVYGWATGLYDTNYMLLASNSATYCALACVYEDMKKKEKKKEEKQKEE